MLKIGDKVIRTGDYYKYKIQEPLRIIDIKDHKPIDGEIKEKAIVLLEDGSWEFYWNLILYKREEKKK